MTEVPDEERARVLALRRYGVVDTGPEPPFDEVARMAGAACSAPIALVCFHDLERVWFKARIGLDLQEAPRADVPFCEQVLREARPIVVPDASLDARFASAGLVTGANGLRFYAGAPILTADGWAIGTLAVADRAPRALQPEHLTILEGLANRVVDLLELRRVRADLALAEACSELDAAERAHIEDTLRRLAPDPGDARAAWRRALPWALGAFLVALGLTLVGTIATRARLESRREARLGAHLERQREALIERLRIYEGLLLAARAVIVREGTLGEQAWRDVVRLLEVEQRYPGLLGLAMLDHVPPGGAAAFEARTGLRLNPAPGPAVAAFPVTHIEPRGRNAPALGFDIGSEERRRAAIQRAIDEARTISTARLELVQGGAGLLVIAPLYRGGVTPATVEERRSDLAGLVDFVVRTDQLLAGLPTLSADYDLELHDGPPGEETLLAASYGAGEVPGAGAREGRSTVDLFGRAWTVRVIARSSFEQRPEDLDAELVLASGLLIALLSAGVMGALASTRHAASALAQRMTAALRASEGRARSIVDHIGDGVLGIDPQGTIETLNPAAERLFAIRGAEVAGRPLSDLLQLREPGDDPASESALGVREARGLRRDGSSFTADVLMTTQDDGRRVAVVRDASQLRGAERRLAAQLAAVSVMAEAAAWTTAGLVSDEPEDELGPTAGRVLEATCRGLGWDAGALYLSGPRDVLQCAAIWRGQRAPAELDAALRGASTEPGLIGRVLRMRRAQGLEDVRAQAADDGAARALAAAGARAAVAAPIGAGRDVLGALLLLHSEPRRPDPELLATLSALGVQVGQFVERRRAEAQLQKSEATTRALVEGMLVGLVVVDQEGQIEAVNPAAARMFGWERQAMRGLRLEQLLPVLTDTDPSGVLRLLSGGGPTPAVETDGLHRSGARFPVELSMVEVVLSGGAPRLAAHVRDVSDRREVDRLKREFVATVSHELRTPLTSIRGALGLLTGGAMGALPDEVRDLVGIAERNAVRLITLINDILDLERLERGKLDLRLAPVDLADVALRAVDAVRGMAEQAGVRVIVDAAPARALGDASRLEQVVVNLLSNAVKFSPRGAEVRVGSQVDAQTVRLSVKDEGRGIPPEFLDRLFQPFQQVESSDARERGGTGLGLAISKLIVERHGGSIEVESTFGRGSAFTLRLPAPPGRPS